MTLDEGEKCAAPGSNGGDWSSLYLILGAVLMPIALPFVVLECCYRLRVKKCRNELAGKVVLITGASSGLGEALAHTFYKAGCKVILAARRVEELERVKKDLLALDAVISSVTYPPVILSLDLAELKDIPDFARKALSVHNKIDILINNGGISVRATVGSSALDVDLKVMVVNYFGSVAITKAILPSMLKQKSGHICFISSVQGKFALPYRSAYSASKHALQAFSDSLRSEVVDKGVQVTCISPGYIRTQLSVNALTGSGKTYGKMDKTTASGMLPEKVADRILNAIVGKEKDVMISDSQAKLAYYARYLFPSLYFWIIGNRARKLEKAEAAEQKKGK
ncbi:PREDICTED: dehydrogenase/reductase SDR family protein 7-like isoform X1 [Rhagoletis zephyria]|uniref:dehydrogenase/reductase SDR family protein 7-like isoform X1 n=2 Tax=Rhagoletis zephyria TaxID=28612 RepID=UPI0008117394|nr:PREDICTED: dehydrogenase/reductase SDR family protein 7-like isoform X1 [Rhagoletis zephyria]XP_017482118.1 PREDICTED: dehydrogenase/reductase SDR family protein 7-like isoform X1 [Rhagoletis zephyria]